jgi:hypothetical protein
MFLPEYAEYYKRHGKERASSFKPKKYNMVPILIP